MVEHDLIISRAIVELFSCEAIRGQLAFRGDTALHKLFFEFPLKYSEDIDLVQMSAGPIGPVFDAIQEILNPILGKPRRDRSAGRATLIYRMESEQMPPTRMRMKVEINTREHFTVLGLKQIPFIVESRWFRGQCVVNTYSLNELLGTKLRALFQRRKGRDLFDIWLGLQQPNADATAVVQCFERYMEDTGVTISCAEYSRNLDEKMAHPGFMADLDPLTRPDVNFDAHVACEIIKEQLVSRIGNG